MNSVEETRTKFLPSQNVPCERKLYKKRWLILFLYILYAAINAFQWFEYSIITNVIMKFYNVGAVAVDWTSIIYMALYMPMVIPASYLMERLDLRKTALIEVTGTFLGTTIKIFSLEPEKIWVTYFAQFILSSMQVFIWALPPRIAAVWFGPKEISLACALGVFGTQLGQAIGFVIPPMVVQNHEDVNQIGEDLGRLVKGLSWITLTVAVFTSVSTLLESVYIVLLQVGRIGLIMVVLGMVGAVVFVFILDKTHAYKKMSTTDNTLDIILHEVGDLGPYQFLVIILVCIGVVLHSGVHVAFVFTALDLNYRCEIPECDSNQSEYQPSWLENAVPFEENVPSKCKRYIVNNGGNFKNCTESTDFNRSETEQCNSFVYKTEELSILQEYDLQCPENLWKLTLIGTINNFGQFCGLFIAGILSDRYGRRVVFIMGLIFCGICGLVRTVAPTYAWFVILEFLDATFGAGTFAVGFIIGVELVGPKRRVLTGTLVGSCYTIGEMLAAGSAWIFKDWRITIYILYGPPMLLFFYFWILPESVRWNLSKGRLEEAKKTLRRLAKFNDKTISESTLEKLERTDNEESTAQFFQIFKSKILLLRFLNCLFCWVTCAFLFYGLTLNSVALAAGNTYLDFMLTALIEIPAYIGCIFIVEKLGRKWSLNGSYSICGISSFVFIFVPQNSQWYYLSLSLWMLGKFGATAAFVVIYTVTSELFPTPLRHTMMGVCSTIGRIGSMVAPQTPLLAQLWTPLPIVLFALTAFTAALLTLLFPETKGLKLPDSIEEAAEIGKKR